ncbi:esterase family protein [Arthrobacter sp. I2-34]|uniref:Esterase family protein n=1 Tax=Arthrobacter hankyongi TaxID=2904801 RepID=A0ABS9LAK6_9MICC|nr:alpha/beta hydrolase-fold protein [Arthrobacter hankyongi]MCG2623719.1 esterase family protein [Arthrobacter hankyongi]
MSHLSLVDGPLPTAISLLAAAAMLWLLAGGRRFWRVSGPLGLIGGAAGAVLLWYLAEQVYGWWDESFPRVLYLWAGAAVAAVLLLVPRLVTTGGVVRRLATVAAALTVAVGAVSQANVQYAAYPTVASMFADQDLATGSITAVAGARHAGSRTIPATTERNWRPPADLPGHGSIYNVAIPGKVSGYRAGKAYVYLPPAYLAGSGNTNLPVLVMIHGKPGGPGSWISSGDLAETMDSYAAEHHGLAPVVIMPDLSMGGAAKWPLCLDSQVARSATYLAVDVPAWVRTTLGAGTANSRQWGIAGLSSGGTCTMQLAANYPQVYPRFLDMSGETEPYVHGGRTRLLRDYFAGDKTAFSRQNALDVLAVRKFPGTVGKFVAGESDAKYGAEMLPVYAAARKAGMDVTFEKASGGHNWRLWSAALAREMPWLMRQLGLAY